MSAIDTTELEELCTLIADCPHSTPVWTDSGAIVLRNQNVRDGRLDLSTPSFTDEEHYRDRIRRAAPTHGDIVITREAPMGEVAMIPEGLRCCLGQRMVLLRPNAKKIVGRYLLFALQAQQVQTQIRWAEGTGSTVSNLRIPDLKKLHIPTPDLASQQAIAEILGTLDDKIELNRRTNETLEAIAKTLFQSWFVDFDPARAKASGEAPESICQRLGLTPELLALFPDEFEDVAGIEIPTGWSFASAGEVSEVGIGKTPPRKESEWFSDNSEHVRWLSIRDMGLSDAFARRSSETLTPEAIERFNIRRVPDYTVLLSFKLTVGRLAITDGEMATNEAIAHFKLNRETRVTTEYLYFYLKNFDFDSLGSTSSIAEAVNSRMIRELPILVPPADLIDAFSMQARGLLMSVKEIGRQTDCLIQTRDTLLPRLLSGEIAVLPAEAL